MRWSNPARIPPWAQEQVRAEGGAPEFFLIRHFEQDPGALGIVVVDRLAVYMGIGQSIVVDPPGATFKTGLRLVDPVRRAGIDAPVETQNAAGVMRLQPFSFGRGG